MAKNNSTKPEKIEAQLFKAADKLCKNIDAAEYKHIVLGLIFLKYISDSFEELHSKLKEGKGKFEGADPEDQDEYKAENVFWVPKNARWSYLHSRAKLPTIGKDLDDAMELIEKENPTLKGILPKVFAKPNLDKSALGGLIDLIGNIALGDEAAKSKDILGKVYEYFLGEFALAEGKKGGQFYTPKSIVKLLVEMIEPYKGRVYDPCCGSGGMFVMSEKFIQEHQGRIDDISIYGQESNQTTYRLARMNLAIRGIDGSQVKWNNEGSFLKDAHPDLKADYILANPPFNDSDWSGELLQNDGRWKYGVPPAGNANFAWVQHFLYHLSPKGKAAFVLANGALASQSKQEYQIRKNLIENNLVDCIVSLPDKLFYNTPIEASLWFLNRNRNKDNASNEILFIDAKKLGYLVGRKNRFFSEKDESKIINIFKNWKKGKSYYADEDEFCCSIDLAKVKEKNYNLSPSIYVGINNKKINNGTFDEFSSLISEKLKQKFNIFKEIENDFQKYSTKYFNNFSDIPISIASKDELYQLGQRIFCDLSENINENKKGKVGDLIKVQGGYAFKSKDFQNTGDIGILKIKNIKNGKVDIYNTQYITDDIAEKIDAKFSISSEEVLIAMTGAEVAKIGIVPKTNKRLFLNQRVGVFREIQQGGLYFIYFLLSSDEYQKKMQNIAYGSAQPNISSSNIEDIIISLPDEDLLKKFKEIIEPIFRLMSLKI